MSMFVPLLLFLLCFLFGPDEREEHTFNYVHLASVMFVDTTDYIRWGGTILASLFC